MQTQTRTYVGESGTAAFDGYAGLRIGQRYVGTAQEGGTVIVSLAPGEPARHGSDVTLKAVEWEKWFKS